MSTRHGGTRPVQPDGYRFDMWEAIGRHIAMFGETPKARSAAQLISAATTRSALVSSRTLPISPPVASAHPRRRCRSGMSTRHASRNEVCELVITRIDP